MIRVPDGYASPESFLADVNAATLRAANTVLDPKQLRVIFCWSTQRLVRQRQLTGGPKRSRRPVPRTRPRTLQSGEGIDFKTPAATLLLWFMSGIVRISAAPANLVRDPKGIKMSGLDV
jgi:hypothetical protein